MYGAAPVVSNG